MEHIVSEALEERAGAHVAKFGDGPVHMLLAMSEQRLTQGLQAYGPVKKTLRGRDFIGEAIEEAVDCIHYLLFRLAQRGEWHEETARALDSAISLALSLIQMHGDR